MHMNFSRQFDGADLAELRNTPLRSIAGGTDAGGSYAAGGGYGARRTNWPCIAAIVALHIAALAALMLFDVIPVGKHPRPTMITLVPVQVAPPPAIPPPPAQPQHAPPPDSDAPPPPDILSTTAVLPSPAPQVYVPPPAPQPVAVAPTPPTAVTAPAAPIVPPSADAATLGNPAPVYPLESRRRHEQGVVRLRVLISVEGRVRDINVARSSGFDRLDRAALDAVRRWRFQPGTQAGVAVEAYGTLAIPFTLT